MKMILLGFLVLTLTVFPSGPVRAQDAATQQQIDKLSGQIQDLLDAQALQGKRIAALEQEVTDLTAKVNQPAAAGASSDDLKKLAAQVQEIDKKRQDDNDLILKQIAKLGSLSGGSSHRAAAAVSDNSTPAPAPGTKQKGYDYEVKSGNTLSGISKAYRDQGVKVSVAQILAANPGLSATSLKVGQKIFIPDPNAK